MKEEDIAYTILMGLGSKYSSLVVILLNTNRNEPLNLTRVMDAIMTEDLRIRELENEAGKADPNTMNPLAYRSDTSFKGSLQYQPGNPYPQGAYNTTHDMDASQYFERSQGAYIARTEYPYQYRHSPYSRGISRGRGRTSYAGQNNYAGQNRHGMVHASSATVHQTTMPTQQCNPTTTRSWSQQQKTWNISNLPWESAPWKPRYQQSSLHNNWQ